MNENLEIQRNTKERVVGGKKELPLPERFRVLSKILTLTSINVHMYKLLQLNSHFYSY